MVEGGRLDVAAAVDPRALAATRRPGLLVRELIHQAGFVPPHGLETAAWQGTPPLTRRCRPLATERCLLIGDAAGYVEPFTGEGIGWAIASAVFAATLVSDHLERWDADVQCAWNRLYAEVLKPNQRSCHVISQLLRRESVRQLALWALRRAPMLARPVVRRLDRPLNRKFALRLRSEHPWP
jgi:flavin-dependent dehydrogenase